MTDIQLGLLIVLVGVGSIYGSLHAFLSMINEELFTPKHFHDEGYNWFGSWTIFIISMILAAPFFIIFTLVRLVGKVIKWLFTV